MHIPITTNFGNEFFGFDVQSSDRSWLFPAVETFNGTQLTISVGPKPPGTYDATITIALMGAQVANIQQTVSVHYVVSAPAVFRVSATTINIHVDKSRPVQPATLTVTSNPS